MGADQTDAATMKAALDKIMLDYDDESKVAVFNDKCEGNKDSGSPPTKRDGYAEYTTPDEIRAFFNDLFTQLGKLANVEKVGPIPAVVDPVKPSSPSILEGDKPKGNVLLTWRTKDLPAANEITYATDSFSWQIKGDKAMVWKQNIVVTEPGKACECVVAVASTCPATGNKVCDGWKNHLDAFGAGQGFAGDAAVLETALTKIMLDYTAESIVQVFDHRDEAYNTFNTPEAIKEMFKQLFTDMQAEGRGAAGTGLAVKLLEVEPTYNGAFLVWESLSHPEATDTFVFNADGKIIRQNIVVQTKVPAGLKVQV